MHDVTKRGLALAVATGGLLITGAAPAVSAVSTHPEHPEHAGNKGQPMSGSSHHAAIPVSGSQVKQYVGRHKAQEQAAGPHHTAAARHTAGAHHTAAAHHTAGAHHATTPRQAAASHGMPLHGTPTAHPATRAVPPSAADAAADDVQAQASALGSPGLLSGNAVEVPVNAPVNACGLVVTAIGGGDEAFGNQCVNGPDMAGGPNSSAAAAAAGSPGVLSGNVVQVPVSVPTNVCGDTVTVVGVHNSAADNLCAHYGGQTSSTANAMAASSPGLGSGNVVQVPIDAPLNVCGITANVVGVDDMAAGNTCVNGGGSTSPTQPGSAGANAATANSPGAITGNVVQVPIEAPINACGDSVSVVGVFNSAFDNHCADYTAGPAGAYGTATDDSGLASGNVGQLPINIPTNVCGVAAAVGAVGDTAVGNTCANTSPYPPQPVSVPAPPASDCPQPPQPLPPQPLPPQAQPPTPLPPRAPLPAPQPPATPLVPLVPLVPQDGPHDAVGMLAHTGADFLGYAGIGAGALVLGAGAVVAGRRRSGSAR